MSRLIPLVISHKLVKQKLTDGYGNTQWAWIGTTRKKNYEFQSEALREDNCILTSLFGEPDLLKRNDFEDYLAQKKSELSYVGRSQLEQYNLATEDGLKKAKVSWDNFYRQQKSTLDASQKGVKGLGASFKTLGKNILAMGTNMLVMAAVAKGIELAVTAINNAAHASERAIEAAENMKTAWDELDNTQKNAEETVSQKGERFIELSKGVDTDGHNLSLTSEQYEEYISLSNEIAGIFPTMVQGFNEQGNAILNTTSGLEGLNEQLNELQRNTRNQKLDMLSKLDEDTGKTGFEGIIARLFAGGSGHIGSYTQLAKLRDARAHVKGLEDSSSASTAAYLYREFNPAEALKKIEGLDDLIVAIDDIELTDAYANPEIQEAVENARAGVNKIFDGTYDLSDDALVTNLETTISGYWEMLLGAFSKVITEQERLVASDLADFRAVSALALEGAFDAGGDANWGGGLLADKYSGTTKAALARGIGTLPAEAFGQIGTEEQLQQFYKDYFAAIANNQAYTSALEKLSQTKTAYDKGEATAGQLRSAQEALTESVKDGDVLVKGLPELIQSYGDSRVEAVYNALAKGLGMTDENGKKATSEARDIFESSLTGKQISAIFEMMGDETLSKKLEGKTGAQGFNTFVTEIDKVIEYREAIASLNETYEDFIENRKTAAELANKETLTPEDYKALTEAGYGEAAQYNPLTGGYDVNYRQYREIGEQKAAAEIAKLQETRAESQEEYNKLLKEANELLADQEKAEENLAKAKEKAARMQELDAEIQRSKLMEAGYRRMASALQAWRDAKDFGESGDEFREVKEAIDDLREGLDEGRIGTNKFRAALELIFGKGALGWNEATLKEKLGTSLGELEKFYKGDGNLDIDQLNSDWESKGVLASYTDSNGEKRYRFADDMTSIEKVAQTLGQPKELVGYMIGALGEYVQGGAEALYGQFTDGAEFLPENENAALDANTSALQALTTAITAAAEQQQQKTEQDGYEELPLEPLVDAQAELAKVQAVLSQTQAQAAQSEQTQKQSSESGQEADKTNDWAEERAQYWNENEAEYRRQINTVAESDANALVKEKTLEGIKRSLQGQLEEIQSMEQAFADVDVFSDVTDKINGLIEAVNVAQSDLATDTPDKQLTEQSLLAGDGANIGEDGGMVLPLEVDPSEANQEIEATQELAETSATKPVNANTSAAMQQVYALNAAIAKPIVKPVIIATAGGVGGSSGTGGKGGVQNTNNSAMADGTSNARGGTTLVAELGPEIIVDRKTGTWRIAKEPQLTTLNKGDIVFNASDTEKILARRGGAEQGKSFATGTQKKKSLTDFAQKHSVVAKFKSSPASTYVAGKLKKSSSNDTKVLGQLMSHYGNSVIEPRSKTDWGGSTSNGSKGGRGGGGGSGGSEAEEEIREVFDWIQRALEVAKKATQKLIKEAAKMVGYIAKNKEIDKALKANQKEIDQNQAGYKRYQEHLRSLESEYGFGPDVVNRVKNGEIDLHKYDEDLRKQVEDYIRWL